MIRDGKNAVVQSPPYLEQIFPSFKFERVETFFFEKKKGNITPHLWYDSYFISINTCRVCGERIEIHIFRRKLHTYIHLD